MKNYYRILNVSRDATQQEIRKAYLHLSQIHHPDKGGDEEIFKVISQAYVVLSDVDERQCYSTKLDIYEITGDTQEPTQLFLALPSHGNMPSLRFRSLHAELFREFSSDPVAMRTDNLQVTPVSQHYKHETLTSNGDTITTHHDNIYAYIAAKERDENLEQYHFEIPHTDLTPEMAVDILIKFLRGYYFGLMREELIRYYSRRLSAFRMNIDSSTISLYESIKTILTTTQQTYNSRKILNALFILQNYTADNLVAALDLLPRLYRDPNFKHLLSHALYDYWVNQSAFFERTQLQEFNQTALLDELQKEYRQSLENHHNDFLLDRLRLVVLLKRLNNTISKQDTTLLDDKAIRDLGFQLYDWLESIAPVSPSQITAYLLIQAGCYFQLSASRTQDPTLCMTDEHMAVNAYANAVDYIENSNAQFALFIGVHVLHLLNQLIYENPQAEHLALKLNRRVTFLTNVIPVIQELTDIKPFISPINLQLRALSQILARLGTYTEEKLLANLREKPTQTDIDTLYLAFEAYLQGWYVESLGAATEQTLRTRLIWAILRQRGWNYLDIEQHLATPWKIDAQYDQHGWMQSLSQLHFPKMDRFPPANDIVGFNFNVLSNGGRAFFTTHLDYIPMGGSISLADIEELLRLNMGGFLFSLDPPTDSQNMPYHPLQQLRIVPQRATGSRIIETAFFADYLLKMLTVGSEIQGTFPYNMRPIDGLIESLPPPLKNIITALHENKAGGHRLHRFWIEADPVKATISEKYSKETGDLEKFTVVIDEPRMRIKKHKMIRDASGNLMDSTDAEDGHPIFIISSWYKSRLETLKGQQSLKLTYPAIVLIKNQYHVIVIEEPGKYREYTLPGQVDIDYLHTLPRSHTGKITPPEKQSDRYYDAITNLTKMVHTPHGFSAEYVFAQQMTRHYDEFSQHFSVLRRLKVFTRATVMVKMQANLRRSLKHSTETMQQQLEDPAYWESLYTKLCANKAFKSGYSKQLKNIIQQARKDLEDPDEELSKIAAYLFSNNYNIYSHSVRYRSDGIMHHTHYTVEIIAPFKYQTHFFGKPVNYQTQFFDKPEFKNNLLLVLDQ